MGSGNHSVEGVPGAALRSWTPIELLHFPLRSSEQCARKYQKTWLAWEKNLRGDLARARAIHEDGGRSRFWDRVVVGDAAVERGVRDGTLVYDTRLRDAMRTLAAGEELTFSSPTVGEDTEYAVEAAVLREADLVRARRQLDRLEPLLERGQRATAEAAR